MKLITFNGQDYDEDNVRMRRVKMDSKGALDSSGLQQLTKLPDSFAFPHRALSLLLCFSQ